MTHQGRVLAICVSPRKGTQKTIIQTVELIAGHGIAGDAHAGPWRRQVSLLADEQVERMRGKGLHLRPGAFGENIVTRGLSLGSLEIGRRLRIGRRAVLQMTQRGKECHERCVIHRLVGDCIMPREGVFARVRRGGIIESGDPIRTDPELDAVRYAVVTASKQEAMAGIIYSLMEDTLAGLTVSRVAPGDGDLPRNDLVWLCDEEVCDIVVTTGGTSCHARDLARATWSLARRGSTIIVSLSRRARPALLDLPRAIQTASGLLRCQLSQAEVEGGG